MANSPSMAAIAREASVGKTTVSLALRDDPRISLTQRKRIQKLAAEMGYRTNPIVSRLMYELRTSRKGSYIANLALINCSRNPQVRQMVDTFDEWARGVEMRADQLGYSMDPFWLHDPAISADRLLKIFLARGIQGAVLYALEGETPPVKLRPVWETLPTVTVGMRFRNPSLNFASNDQYSTSMQATLRLRGMGFQRIGIIVDRWIDEMLESRFTGGYQTGAPPMGIPPLYVEGYLAGSPSEDIERVRYWLHRYRPDVCILLSVPILKVFRKLDCRVPEDVSVAVLDILGLPNGQVAGMNQRHVLTGMGAMDALSGQILRREMGPPLFQQGILVESLWQDGPTLRSSRKLKRQARTRKKSAAVKD